MPAWEGGNQAAFLLHDAPTFQLPNRAVFVLHSPFVLCNDIFLGVGTGLVRNSFPRVRKQEEEQLQVTESLVEAEDLG